MDTLFQLRLPAKAEAELRAKLAKLQIQQQKEILDLDRKMENLINRNMPVPEALREARLSMYYVGKKITMPNLVRLSLLAGVERVTGAGGEALLKDLMDNGVALGRRRQS